MSDEQVFPIELYKQVMDQLDPHLVETYIRLEGDRLFDASLSELCAQMVNRICAIPTCSARKNDWRGFRKQCARKRKRWAESVKGSMQLPTDSRAYPFAFVYQQKENWSKTEWKECYGNATVPVVIRKKLAEVDTWAASHSSLFIDFPARPSLTRKRLQTALSDDIQSQVYLIMNRICGLDIGYIYKPYTDAMIDLPVFTAGTKKKVEPGQGMSIPMNEEHSSMLVLSRTDDSESEKDALMQMDLKDRTLLSRILQAVTEQPVMTTTISIPVRALAACLMPYTSTPSESPSSRLYKTAVRRVFNIARSTYRHYTDGVQDMAINYLDSARYYVSVDGSPHMEITIGKVFADAILNRQIRRFSTQDYNRLTSSTGQAIFLQMQRLRIMTIRTGPDKNGQYTCILPYSHFMRMIPLTGKKRDDWPLIKDAMRDFVNHKILLSEAGFDNVNLVVSVVFLPLTDDELKGLAWDQEWVETGRQGEAG